MGIGTREQQSRGVRARSNPKRWLITIRATGTSRSRHQGNLRETAEQANFSGGSTVCDGLLSAWFLLGVLSPILPAGATLALPLSEEGGAAFKLIITPVFVLLSDFIAAALLAIDHRMASSFANARLGVRSSGLHPEALCRLAYVIQSIRSISSPMRAVPLFIILAVMPPRPRTAL